MKNKKKSKANTKNVVASTTVATVTSPTYASKYSYNTTVAKKPVYTYKGKKNQTEYPEFIDLCKKTQEELLQILPKQLLAAGYTDVVTDEAFIYAKGTLPVLLTAHLDTVHKERIKDFYEWIDKDGRHILSSPQGIGGDDRAGVYSILEIIKDFKPSILFCTDEEIGGIGSRKFCKTEFINELSDLKYLIELDRANENDAVFYDCANTDFIKFIEDNTGYKKEYGSFSDISNLAPKCKVAAVNFSCGYYNAHTLGEEVVVEEMLTTIETVKKLLTVECEQFEYVKAYSNYKYGYGYGGYGYGSGYGRYSYDYDAYDDDFYYNYYRQKTNSEQDTSKVKSSKETIVLYITFYDPETFEDAYDNSYGSTVDEAWVNFFKSNPDVCWNSVVDYDIDYV